MTKKSFILHVDSLSILDKLNTEQKGLLFNAIHKYHLGEDVELDFALELAFEPFKNQFERDLEKYNKRCEVNRGNGSKGGKRKVANATKRKKSQTNVADSDNDSKKDNDNVKDSIKERREVFKTEIGNFLDKYGKEMCNDFYHYWTEKNTNAKKMRFEMSKNQPFNVKRRLINWNSRTPPKKPDNKTVPSKDEYAEAKKQQS